MRSIHVQTVCTLFEDLLRDIIYQPITITQATIEPSCHLYEVSGTGILSMKAAEVTPKASSLHSGHAYILLGPQGEYVWSGQFSNQAQRRGALLIAKALNKSKSVYI